MRHCRSSAALWIIAAMFLAAFTPLAARSAEIWLSPQNPLPLRGMQPVAALDYFELFKPDAPWTDVADKIRVFKLPYGLALYGTDEQLRSIFGGLRQRGIALGLEVMALTGRKDCGEKVEGYSKPGAIAEIAERIHRLGGDLQYVAMDEPLWNGHAFAGRNACRAPLADIAADIAGTVRAIKHVFPAAHIGDIETLGRTEPADLSEELLTWTKLFATATGQPLAFVHFDVVWSGPWLQQYERLVPRLRAAGLRVGMIYNGDADDQTDLAWTKHAEQRFVTLEANPALAPADAIFQSWVAHPSHVLPDTQPGTLTWLVGRYLTAQSRLVLRHAGDRLEGQLTDTQGRAMPDATVIISALTNGEADRPPVRTLSGDVPAKATSALFALRINTECQCSGTANVMIAPMTFRDRDTGAVGHYRFAAGQKGSAVDFRTHPGQKIVQNTPHFEVAANHPFVAEIPDVDGSSIGGKRLCCADFL